MQKTTICLINQKGGCGKSSTCFHLSHALASRQLRVLLIDADPQASLSQGFFGSEAVERLPRQQTLAALYDDETHLSSSAELVCPTPFENVAIIRANNALAPHNVPVPEQTGMRQFALRTLLEDLNAFDFVLIDCPPNLYQCSWNAMLASDRVLIPVPPEDFGTQGLRTVHQALDRARQLNPTLSLLGQLITRSDRRLNVHRTYQAKLRQLYGGDVLNAVVPEASAFKVALACRRPITAFAPRTAAAESINRLADEVIGRIGGHTHQCAV